MVSLFQVRKKKERLELVENLDEENKTGGKKDDINVQEVANVDDGKRPVVDQKQSFVDQVAEGLAAKLSPDRFVKDGESSPSGEEQLKDTKDTSDTKGQAVDSDSKESPAAANNEEEKKAEDDDAPNEKTDTSASKAAENTDRKKSETISESNIVEGLGSTTEDK